MFVHTNYTHKHVHEHTHTSVKAQQNLAALNTPRPPLPQALHLTFS